MSQQNEQPHYGRVRHEQLRRLPAIDQLLQDALGAGWFERWPRGLIVEALQSAVAAARTAIVEDEEGTQATCGKDILEAAYARLVRDSQPGLRQVINATGVVLHTGLGRAPLSKAALLAIAETAGGYCNIETDLETGNRGRRTAHVEDLLCKLTGAEAATVVNNNAAATLLILNTVADGAEVVVSRGQLVEIGGSFRLPEVMAAGGAILREVGTTNRTRLADYESVLNENTAALMRIHTSNYRIVGFTEETPIEQLVGLGQRHHKIVIDDLGSGALGDSTTPGPHDEPTIRASLRAGADLVCFSGDKLLGGPQAGIILGRRDLVAQIETNPLMRTYRVGKLTLAALEATLRICQDDADAQRELPTQRMLLASTATLQRRAEELVRHLRALCTDESFVIVEERSVAGGGSLPGEELETRCVAWQPAALSVDDALADLRNHQPAVMARALRNAIHFDLHAVADEEIATLAVVINGVAAAKRSSQ